jgi:hypothetical protein
MSRPVSCQDCEKQSVCEICCTILRNADRAYKAKEALKGTETAMHKDLCKCIARHCAEIAFNIPEATVCERSSKTGSLLSKHTKNR